MKLPTSEQITLLGYYLSILPPRWKYLQSYIAVYLSLVTSVVGATIAASAYITDKSMSFLLIVGPILVVTFSGYAKVTIKKQVKHIRELIVVIAKLEYTIGLYEKEKSDKPLGIPWPDDDSFLTPKWVRSRYESGSNSDDFINAFPDSTAHYACQIFLLMQIIGLIMAVFLLALAFGLVNRGT